MPSRPHLSRRSFLKIGAFGASGLTLPQLLRAEHTAGIRSSRKSVILIYLVGGPPHQDMFDLKPNAPSEIAGPWRPIATNVNGIQIGEAFPKLAGMMDKLAIVRSLVGNQADHDAQQVFHGHHPRRPTPNGGWPQFGSAVSRVLGAPDRATPAFISLCYTCTHGPYNEPGPGFLGASHSAFRPMGPSRNDMILRGVSVDRLADRRTLLQSFDAMRREVDTSGMLHGMDTFSEQAFGLLTSSRLAEALDLSREDPRVVARYDTSKFFTNEYVQSYYDMRRASNLLGKQMLLARRLCEAGCGFVTVSDCGWDMHANNNSPRNMAALPLMAGQVDHAVAAFLEDLEARGLSDKILLVVTGEMGRTPRKNNNGGRDHWGNLTTLLLAGGGLRMGQVIGRSDSQAGSPATERFGPSHLMSTIMHTLLDIGEVRVQRDLGRVANVISDGTPIAGLL
jgi:uncharacterized protein (DUF1501 family)